MSVRPAAELAAAALLAAGLALASVSIAGASQHEAAAALQTLDGEPAELPLESGALLVNFWATWCPPCRHELPLLDEVAASDQARFAVVAVAVDSLEASRDYWQDNSLGFETLVAGLTAGPRMMEHYGNVRTVMPYSVLLAPDGSVLASKTGPFATAEEILDFGNSAS